MKCVKRIYNQTTDDCVKIINKIRLIIVATFCYD